MPEQKLRPRLRKVVIFAAWSLAVLAVIGLVNVAGIVWFVLAMGHVEWKVHERVQFPGGAVLLQEGLTNATVSTPWRVLVERPGAEPCIAWLADKVKRPRTIQIAVEGGRLAVNAAPPYQEFERRSCGFLGIDVIDNSRVPPSR